MSPSGIPPQRARPQAMLFNIQAARTMATDSTTTAPDTMIRVQEGSLAKTRPGSMQGSTSMNMLATIQFKGQTLTAYRTAGDVGSEEDQNMMWPVQLRAGLPFTGALNF